MPKNSTTTAKPDFAKLAESKIEDETSAKMLAKVLEVVYNKSGESTMEDLLDRKFSTMFKADDEFLTDDEDENHHLLDMKNIDLSDADFSGYDFGDYLDLSGCNFSDCNLEDCYIHSISDANFTGANMKSVEVGHGDTSLHNCNFTNANLQEADFNCPEICTNLNFTNANFSNAEIGGEFENCNFTNANLSNTEFAPDLDKKCNFTDANLTDATIEDVSFYKGVPNFTRTNFTGTDLQKIEEQCLAEMDLSTAILPKGFNQPSKKKRVNPAKIKTPYDVFENDHINYYDPLNKALVMMNLSTPIDFMRLAFEKSIFVQDTKITTEKEKEKFKKENITWLNTYARILQYIYAVHGDAKLQEVFGRCQVAYASLHEPDAAIDIRQLKFQDLRGLDLRGINLPNPHFSGWAALDNTDLSYADLDGGVYAAVSLYNTNFSRAKMHKSEFLEARIGRTDFSNAKLDESQFVGSFPDGVVNFSNASLVKSSFLMARSNKSAKGHYNFSGADMTKANCNGAGFENSDFTDTKLISAKLEQTRFEGSTLIRTDFTKSNPYVSDIAGMDQNKLSSCIIPKELANGIGKILSGVMGGIGASSGSSSGGIMVIGGGGSRVIGNGSVITIGGGGGMTINSKGMTSAAPVKPKAVVKVPPPEEPEEIVEAVKDVSELSEAAYLARLRSMFI